MRRSTTMALVSLVSVLFITACAEASTAPRSRFTWEIHQVEPGTRCIMVKSSYRDDNAAVDCWQTN